VSDSPDVTTMTDKKPYMMRAIYEWIADNGLTPYMVVQADLPGVQVPEQFVQDGKITLNIAERSVQSLNLGNDDVMFSATFGGQLEYVRVPCGAVAALFARENGQGMAFEVQSTEMLAAEAKKPLESVDTDESDTDNKPDGPDDNGPSSGSKKRPSLKVVK